MIDLLTTVGAIKARLRPAQQRGHRVALVATMGALHDGHLSLVRAARERADVVVASIFVNPKQFGPNEDLDRYPRDLSGDADKLASAGCDLLFAPTREHVYPASFETTVALSRTPLGLCGGSRPGHFDGVTTVVLKLLMITRPDVAVFGEKDFQQLTVLRRMAEDLCLDTEILGAPLVREPDGLAMSSRNAYLSQKDRRRALGLSKALRAAADIYAGGQRDATAILGAAREVLRAHHVDPEYLELRAFSDLATLARADRPSVVLVAAPVGATRLIDNWILERPAT